MPGCPTHTRPLLFLWRFDHNGYPYMDSRLDIKTISPPHEAVRLARGMELRMRFNNGSKMALFHIPLDMTIDQVEDYIESSKADCLRGEIIKKLNDAEVRVNDFVGPGTNSTAVEFIHSLAEECGCGIGQEEMEG